MRLPLLEPFIWASLFGALLQGFSFAFSRQLLTYSTNRVQVAFYSLLATATLSLVMAPVVGIGGIARAPGLILAFGVSVALSQVLLMEAMRRADASFVTPVLGIKVFLVAFASGLLWAETYHPLVYLGAVGTFISLYFLNDGTFRAPPAGLILTVLAATAFGCNDLFVMQMLRLGFSGPELVIYSMLAPLLILGPLGLWQSRGSLGMSWPYARALAIYGVLQLSALLAITLAFMWGMQVTMVAIIQNTRGVFGLLAVYLFARLGLAGVERLTGRQYRLRLIGAVLMTASVSLAILAR